ncbi:MAG TPA: hypothetical protein VNH11_09695 [Pirellulales bacterium]|nr:hypothetical protein [Pirellulales bacterium]
MNKAVTSLIWSGLAVFAGGPTVWADKVAATASTANRDESAAPGVPLGTEPRRRETAPPRFQGGRWWFLSRENRWLVWENGRWVPYSPQKAPRSAEFDRRFATYRGYQVGQRRLQTSEGGQAELATDEISEPGEASETFAVGGIPRRQEERRHTGIRRAAEEQQSDWFKSGSPFGNRYGYGSGFGYGGYGYNNPYGYGPRTGSGGGFSYGFGPYGAVGGQTGSQASGMGGGGPTLIRAEPSSLGAPGELGKGSVGGGVTRAGRRKLGGSAASSGSRD